MEESEIEERIRNILEKFVSYEVKHNPKYPSQAVKDWVIKRKVKRIKNLNMEEALDYIDLGVIDNFHSIESYARELHHLYKTLRENGIR